jgi:hypothetical protein
MFSTFSNQNHLIIYIFQYLYDLHGYVRLIFCFTFASALFFLIKLLWFVTLNGLKIQQKKYGFSLILMKGLRLHGSISKTF